MDFKIIAANNYAAASKSIVEMLKKTDQTDLETNHVIISNDRCLMSSEFEMLDALGGSFNTQVLTFARLTSRLMTEKTFISKQSAIMLINRLAEELSGEFLCFTKSFDTPGFAANIYETISQLKYSAISPQDVNPDNYDNNLRLKMHDIKLLYQAYEDFIKDRYIDSGTKLQLLADAIPHSDFVKSAYFYIKDFDNFSAQEVQIIRQLVIWSKGVVVALPYMKGKRVYIKDSFEDMLTIAKGLKINADVTYLVDNQPNFVGHIQNNLFDFKTNFEKKKTKDVLIAKECDVFAEAETVARYIADKTHQGDRYKDFLVVVGDVTKYVYAIEREFGKYGVPYFIDNKTALDQHALSKYILDILRAKHKGFLREDCLAVLKNCFYPFEGNFCQFENYCFKNNLRYFGKKFDTYDEQSKEAEQIRSQLTEYIRGFGINEKDHVGNYAKIIKDFLCDEKTIFALEQIAKTQSQIDVGLCKVSAQVSEKLLAVTDTMVALFGEKEVTLEKFANLLQAGIEAETISVLPLFNDCVVVTNVGKSRANSNKNLIVMGANDGSFPVVKGDTKIVSDKDIDLLKDKGINLSPKTESENFKEKFNVFQLLTAPRKSLFVTYVAAGDKATPCLAVEELSKMFELDDKYIHNLKQGCQTYSKKQAKAMLVEEMSAIAHGNTADKEMAGRLRAVFGDENLDVYVYDETQKPKLTYAKQLLIPRGKTSVTKIEVFYSCPYRYFLANGLKIKKRDMGELKSVDTGTIIHDVLENFVDQVFVKKQVAEPEELAKQLVEKALSKDEFQYLTKKPKLMHVVQKIRNEAVDACKEIYIQIENSSFKPFRTEQEFGFDSENSWPAVKISVGENEILLNGKIDRIDCFNENFVIVDYKTGSASFDDVELYVGKKLQLLTYVKAVLTNLKKDCAGFFYMPINDSFGDGSQKRLGYIGRVLNRADILSALENTAPQNKKHNLLGLSLTKDGVLKKNVKAQMDEKLLDTYLAYTDLMLKNAVKDMADGFIGQHPYGNVCDFCDFSSVCNFNDFGGKSENITSINDGVLEKAVKNDI